MQNITINIKLNWIIKKRKLFINFNDYLFNDSIKIFSIMDLIDKLNVKFGI